MYKQHWGLSRRPFENHAAPEFFCPIPCHQAALLKLRYVIENRLEAALLVGGTGCGKTFLMRVLTGELEDRSGPVIAMRLPRMTAPELLAWLTVELGADDALLGRGPNSLDLVVYELERALVRLTKSGRHPLLIVEDAHLIEDHGLFQALLFLLNLQEPGRIEFSLFLLGESNLGMRIRRMTQLDQRIPVRSLLEPLSADETQDYVTHRLRTAGATGVIFDSEAMSALFDLSNGVPRQINRLGDLVLLVGYADRVKRVTADMVEAVAEELVAPLPV